MKKLLLLLPLGLLGLYLTFLPQVNTAIYDHQVTVILNQWEQQTGRSVDHSRAHPLPDALFPELLQNMADYNIFLSEHQQEGLTSPEVFEKTPLQLSDYGLEDDTPIATLTIEAIELQLPVYLGATDEHMSKGAAVLGQTSLPIGGESTNCVIAGHRGYRGIPYFRHLDRLQEGDEVILSNLWEDLHYRVVSVSIIQPNDLEAISIQEGEDLLTLLTCHPYTVGTQRLIILCKRVKT